MPRTRSGIGCSNTAARTPRSSICWRSTTPSSSRLCPIDASHLELPALASPGENEGAKAQEQPAEGGQQRHLADAGDDVVLTAQEANPVASGGGMAGLDLADLRQMPPGQAKSPPAGNLEQGLHLVRRRAQIADFQRIQG